jgi:hypothetical protein
MLRLDRLSCLFLSGLLGTALLVPVAAKNDAVVASYPFATPTFGLADAPDGSLLVADAGSGIVELRNGSGALVAELPGVSDIAPIGRGVMFATTGGNPEGPNPPTARKLYRVSRGSVREIADLGAFEASVNPDGGAIDSNPFDVAPLDGGSVLVADAAANALLIVNNAGEVDWVATLPNELVPTSNVKSLAHCPAGPPQICNLPAMIPAQPVTASVAIGPDGAYYVGELKGFPAPTGRSKVWRIEPGTRHAACGSSAACSVVASGFTSIIDLTFGDNGTLYVTELDEASWFAIQGGFGGAVGGTVNACTLGGSCTIVAGGLTMPIATTFDKSGQLYVLKNALIPGAAQVAAIP